MNRRQALIGHTGFVGSNLRRQWAFDDLYNSSNIDDLRGKTYDTVVCAGARAEKWRINQNPTTDWFNIQHLTEVLATVDTARMLLISTVDVYARPIRVHEGTPISPDDHTQAYGRHRLLLEEFCRERFATVVARLPSLFGAGLKKNVIYDFLHDNNIDQIHADSVYQFYDLARLGADLERAMAHELSVINLATEPTSVTDVAWSVFERRFNHRPPGAIPATYDMRSQHDHLYGHDDGYLYGRAEVIQALQRFVSAARAKT